MATRRPIVLVSGVQAEMPRGDVIDTGLNVTLQPNPSGLYFTGDNKLGFDGQGDNIQVIAQGVNAVYRTVQDKSRDIVSVKDFGAIGDGVTDDTAAIQSALNSANKKVFLNPGLYNFTSLTIPSGVALEGDTPYLSVLYCTSAIGTAVTAPVSSSLRNLKILSVDKTSGFLISITGNGVKITDCEFGNYYIAITAGTIGGSLIVNPVITRCSFRDPSPLSAGGGALQLLNFSNVIISDCLITGDGFSNQPSFGIRFQNGDTAFLSNTNITLHGRALLVDPPSSSNCYALTVNGSIFDSAGSLLGGGTASSSEFNPAGGVWNTRISNTWFGLSQSKSGCSLLPTGSGVVDGITFTGCEFTDNGDSGLIAVGSGVKNWTVTGGHSGGNANSGIRAASATSNFNIVGHIAGNISGRGPNNFGITVDAAASNNYVIANNTVVGNTAGSISDGGTGTTASVVNNLGYNGSQNVAGLTVGSSPWSYTAGHTSETLYFAGGTVSEIRVDGQIVQNTTAATILLVPSQTMQVTYSSAPTILRKIN